MTTKRKFTKQGVVRLVGAQLATVGHGVQFDILEAGVRADGDWWYVPVISTLRGKPVKRDVVVSVFANAESDLHAREGLTVLLVPVVD